MTRPEINQGPKPEKFNSGEQQTAFKAGGLKTQEDPSIKSKVLAFGKTKDPEHREDPVYQLSVKDPGKEGQPAKPINPDFRLGGLYPEVKLGKEVPAENKRTSDFDLRRRRALPKRVTR